MPSSLKDLLTSDSTVAARDNSETKIGIIEKMDTLTESRYFEKFGYGLTNFSLFYTKS